VIPENYFEEFPSKVHQLILQERPSVETFKIPENYFSEFESKMHGKTTLPLEVNPEIPSNYFDDLPQIIQEKIRISEQKKDWSLLPAIPNWSMALAAGVTLLIGFALWNYHETSTPIAAKKILDTTQVCLIKKKQNIEVKVSPNTQKQIEKHVQEQLIEHLDESLIIDELAANDDSQMSKDDMKEINNYLIENNIDESMIQDVSN
jgi:hypothetical protein